jgi:hypothetical protein
MVKSGILYSFGLGFWGPNGHDGVWHIALANSLARGEWAMPTFAGYQLQNYHIGFDLVLVLLHRITSISTQTLYFQILPPIFAILIGLLTYQFILGWRRSKLQALWALFFVYFGGSWGWLITLLRGQGFGGESMFWSQQAVSTLLNPPFALSLVVLVLGLVFLQRTLNKPSILYTIYSILLFGVLIEIKSYAGILVLSSLFVTGVYFFLKEKNLTIFIIFLGSLILSVILFLPLNKQAPGLLVFQPFWFLETMMGLSDRFYWRKLYEAMMNYRLDNSPKLFPAYFFALAIFWIGNLGTRVIKEILLLRFVSHRKLIGNIEVFITTLVVAAVILPMLFLQKGTPWNTIQFLYFALFFSGILAGCVVGEFLEKRKSVAMTCFIILLTIPTTISTLVVNYLPSRPPAKLSIPEINALHFLAGQPNGIVLTYPYDSIKAQEAIANPPRPLYLYESTAYVSAYANKPIFLEDQVNLDITGYPWRQRRKEIEEFYKSTDHMLVWNFLRTNKIMYIYWLKGQRATLGESQLGIERIYENEEVDIYRVKM